jgi:predicted O-methyltransferase YrrM
VGIHPRRAHARTAEIGKGPSRTNGPRPEVIIKKLNTKSDMIFFDTNKSKTKQWLNSD